MTAFVFSELVNAPLADIYSAALGTDGTIKSVDVGKAVKMGTANNYVPCVAGDEIEGVIVAVEPFSVNDGKSFGSVQTNKRVWATVGAGQGATPMAVLGLVVADDQVAIGTESKPQVKTGAPTKFLWRVIRVVGTGAAGSSVLIERI